jgi:hypothetical protein
MSSDNLTITITDGMANITPIADWCGIENVEFYGDAVKNDVFNSTTLKVSVTCVNDPPVLNSFEPTGTNVSVKEGESLVFKINVTDIDTEQTLMVYKWFVDDTQQASIANIFTYSPDYDDAGTHNVSVVFNDTEFEDGHLWTGVVVKDVNREPQNVRIIEPENNITVKKGKKVSFKAGTATDPDGDKLTYTWFDGTEEINNSQTFDYKFKKKGMHTIKLQVSDGHGAVVELELSIKVKVDQQNGPGFEALVLVLALVVAVVVIRGRRR